MVCRNDVIQISAERGAAGQGRQVVARIYPEAGFGIEGAGVGLNIEVRPLERMKRVPYGNQTRKMVQS